MVGPDFGGTPDTLRELFINDLRDDVQITSITRLSDTSAVVVARLDSYVQTPDGHIDVLRYGSCTYEVGWLTDRASWAILHARCDQLTTQRLQ